MTESEDLIQALKEFTNLFAPVWLWKLDSQFHVLHSDCPNESLFCNLLLRDGRRKAIENHMATSDKPVCFTVSSMLSWVIEFATENEAISSIHVMGPFFLSANDPENYSDYLAPMKLSEEAEQTLRDGLRQLPVISHTALAQNAVLLHYCVRHEKLRPDEIVYYVSQPKHQKQRRKVETNQFEKSSGRWALEQELLNRIRQGDLSAENVLSGAGQHQAIQAFGNIRNVQSVKLNVHQLLTLISRAAVEGGLPQKTSFSLCSEYRDRLEKCATVAQLEAVSNEIVRDYAGRVRNMKRFSKCSPQVRLCCEYIDTHPGEKLTLEELAQKAGYSPFHMSRKFQREMNCSIIEYIQHSKLERAKYLLTHTQQSIDDISEELGFNSRSYFTTVFKKKEGMTPSDYRRENSLV